MPKSAKTKDPIQNTVLGLDLSLTSTGVILLDRDGGIVRQETVRTKPNGNRPPDEINRLNGIVDRIFDGVNRKNVLLCAVEQVAFSRNMSSHSSLVALNYFVRKRLMELGIPFILISPTSAKKFASGDGKAQKDMMLLETYRRWGVAFDSSDLCDAYVMARIGMITAGIAEPENAYQREIIKKLSGQLLETSV
ncbi:MAG: crossover junction endodeoxyribonuclease RuvC [Thermodesulfovibrionales bacterium]|jgi:crossover junction endodeoxyribonuclease RuvC